MKSHTLIVAMLLPFLFAGVATKNAIAQSATPSPLRDALTLDATAAIEVIPDLAVITMVAEAQGSDAAAITREVQTAVNAALAQAKSSPSVEARTGGFSTSARYNNKGARDAWSVRAELVLKGKDFAVLGGLAGKLAQQKMMILSSAFELSRELRDKEEQALIERGISAFRSKALVASRAFGFANYSLREVNLASINAASPMPEPRVFAMRGPAAAAQDAEPVAIVGGKVTLSLTVSGTVVMSK